MMPLPQRTHRWQRTRGLRRRPRRAGRSVARALAGVSLVGTAAACELREITIADAEDVVIAEFVLIAGARVQTGILHRTQGTDAASEPVVAESVIVTASDGSSFAFEARPASHCLLDEADGPGVTCYANASSDSTSWVESGSAYSLRIELADGQLLTAVTNVPDAFTLIRPAVTRCALQPGRTLEIAWRQSAGAWVYAAETELRGLRAALAPVDIDVPADPLRLFGLAVSGIDTTITFPSEFGVFDRFDSALTDVLAAIQGGLPPLVEAEIVVAAADRNYVNWERGGAFNPSGFVRVPSVFGDGTGVFASVVPRAFTVVTIPGQGLPACLPDA